MSQYTEICYVDDTKPYQGKAVFTNLVSESASEMDLDMSHELASELVSLSELFPVFAELRHKSWFMTEF